MKTVSELKDLLISLVEDKTNNPFPSEPLFILTAENAAKTMHNTTYDGVSMQDHLPEEVNQTLIEHWLGDIKMLINQARLLSPTTNMTVIGVSLSDIRDNLDDYQTLFNSLQGAEHSIIKHIKKGSRSGYLFTKC